MRQERYLGSVCIERGVIVGLSQEGLDGQQHSAHSIEGAPLLLQDVQADVAVLVNIGMEARRLKLHQRSFEGVVCTTHTCSSDQSLGHMHEDHCDVLDHCQT